MGTTNPGSIRFTNSAFWGPAYNIARIFGAVFSCDFLLLSARVFIDVECWKRARWRLMNAHFSIGAVNLLLLHFTRLKLTGPFQIVESAYKFWCPLSVFLACVQWQFDGSRLLVSAKFKSNSSPQSGQQGHIPVLIVFFLHFFDVWLLAGCDC